MAIEGLTPQQSDFVERFLRAPAPRPPAADDPKTVEEYRRFNAGRDLLCEDIALLADAEAQTRLLADLAAAEGRIAATPPDLDFAGAGAAMKVIEAEVTRQLRQQRAQTAYQALKMAMETRGQSASVSSGEDTGVQRDIALTWGFIEDQMKAGDAAAFEAASRAMARLDAMLRTEAAKRHNPFDADTAEPGTAQQVLADTFDGMAALNDKLAAEFGVDGVPLALRLICSSAQNRLTEARTAGPSDLPQLAEDAQVAFQEARREGEAVLREAGEWTKAHAAFRVRYLVMEAHPQGKDTQYVKPAFDTIRAAYSEVKAQAERHEYAQATEALADLRNDLKDALDLADDFAAFVAKKRSCAALVAALPEPASYLYADLKSGHSDAVDLLRTADAEYDAGKLTSALSLLNRVPDAVAELRESIRYTRQITQDKATWQSLRDTLSQQSAELIALIADEIAQLDNGLAEVQDLCDVGYYMRAAPRMAALLGGMNALSEKAERLKAYLADLTEHTARLGEVDALQQGAGAVLPYRDALSGDEAKRAAAHAKGDYALAHRMCNRLAGQHEAQMAIAAQAAKYAQALAAFDGDCEALSAETSVAAKEAHETARTMRENAVAATLRGNWVAATGIIENATLEVKRALGDAATADLIDGMQGGPDGRFELTEDSEFAALYENFVEVLDLVRVLDMEEQFADDLDAADALALSAEAQMATDLGQAETTLNAAVEACRAVARQLSASESYGTQRDVVAARIQDAEGSVHAALVESELDAAKADLAQADERTAAPIHDFIAGLHALVTAQGHLRRAADVIHAYEAIVLDALRQMKSAMDAYREHPEAVLFKEHLDELQRVTDQMQAAFAARDLAQAAARGAEGEALAKSQPGTCKDCDAARAALSDPRLPKPGDAWGHPATMDEEKDVAQLYTQATTAFAAGQFGACAELATKALRVARRAQAKAAAFDAYLPTKVAAERRIAKLETRAPAPQGQSTQTVAALRRILEQARDKEAQGNYASAHKALAGFDAACDAAEAELAMYDRFALLRDRASEALETVRQLNAPAIETLMVRLEAKYKAAEKAAQGNDFALASTLLKELITECGTAEGTAQTVTGFVAEAALVEALQDDDADDLSAAIARAKDRLSALGAAPSAVYVAGDLTHAGRLLESAEAKADDDFAAARLEVAKVFEIAAALAVRMTHFDRLNDAAGVARKLGADLLAQTPQVALLRDEVTGHLDQLQVCMRAARASDANRPEAEQDVDRIIAALRPMGDVLGIHKKYLVRRAELMVMLHDLEQSDARPIIRDVLTQVRKDLAAAEAAVQERRHTEAGASLDAASTAIELAQLRAKLAQDTTPAPEDFEAILNAPDGFEQLESILETLPPAQQETVMAMAFEAKFGCKLDAYEAQSEDDEHPQSPDARRESTNASEMDLKALFKEMERLPESETLDDDSVLVVQQQRGAQEGEEKKTIRQPEGEAETAHLYTIAVAHEIGELDERAVPKQGEERTTLSWNTLHEVGQAVNDKLGYMKKHGERLAGWKSYGADVQEPAAAIAAKFQFDAGYVANYMLGAPGKALPIPDPVDCGIEEWHRRMQDCRAFVDRARTANSPWASASVADACAVGEHTYVESYPKDWHRYQTSARKLAVSGYQFRAPGEWFSELFAAIHTDRINDNHPHLVEMLEVSARDIA